MPNIIEGKELVQSPYGLLGDASKVINLADANSHWVSGFSHKIVDTNIDVKNLPVRVGDPNADFDQVIKSMSNGSPILEYSPFIIEARSSGTTFGATVEDYEKDAKETLLLATQRAVEQEFWTGKLSKLINDENPLTDRNYIYNRFANDSESYVVKLGTGAVSVRQGLSLLEEALGDTNGFEGVIHAPRRLASLAKIREYLKDGMLRTNLHTPVVAGTGYTKIGDKYYMVATGPVTVVLGDIEIMPGNIQQSVNIRNNTVEYIAQRPAAVFWNTEKAYVVEIDPNLN